MNMQLYTPRMETKHCTSAYCVYIPSSLPEAVDIILIADENVARGRVETQIHIELAEPLFRRHSFFFLFLPFFFFCICLHQDDLLSLHAKYDGTRTHTQTRAHTRLHSGAATVSLILPEQSELCLFKEQRSLGRVLERSVVMCGKRREPV